MKPGTIFNSNVERLNEILEIKNNEVKTERLFDLWTRVLGQKEMLTLFKQGNKSLQYLDKQLDTIIGQIKLHLNL